MPDSSSPIEIFCCYAHKDEPLQQALKNHLSAMKHQGRIFLWYDREIVPGTDWAQSIDSHLNSASVILLLISSDFLASDYCYGVEMKCALERHQANEARVISIILRSVDWKGEPFEHLQVLPTDAKPITSWRNRDEAFANVATGIRRAIEDLEERSQYHSKKSKQGGKHSTSSTRQNSPLFMADDLPTDFIPRPHEFAVFKKSLLQGPYDHPRAITSALLGAGGYGKTTLALALCHDLEVQAAFRNGVLWVTLGDQTAHPLAARARQCYPLRAAQRLSVEVAAPRFPAWGTVSWSFRRGPEEGVSQSGLKSALHGGAHQARPKS